MELALGFAFLSLLSLSTLTAPAPANNSTSCLMDLNFLTRSNRLELDSLPEFQTASSISGDGEAQINYTKVPYSPSTTSLWPNTSRRLFNSSSPISKPPFLSLDDFRSKLSSFSASISQIVLGVFLDIQDSKSLDF
ncbi:hypothetical protein TorRG33x02_185020 [Trema orientale]|uniref:Uncharacterized protein n=1 Tax=Trema orientale TaxID=63057 RepID=A0A2P5EJC1_TREOI|nr:hypothetical protein TorRG33x02_185020 [Trema orientale]